MSESKFPAVRLEIKRSFTLKNKWSWSVIFDNGHVWEVSSGHRCMFMAIISAVVFGMYSFKSAEKYIQEFWRNN